MSVLSAAAAALPVGQWTTITTNNMFPGGGAASIFEPSGAGQGSILQFANTAFWDPINKKLRFVGIEHANDLFARHVIYDDASNTWSIGSTEAGWDGLYHAYDHNTGDPDTGDHWYKHDKTTNLYKRTDSASSWSLINSAVPHGDNVASGIAFFKERASIIWSHGSGNGSATGGAHEYNIAGNSWANIGPSHTLNLVGSYETFTTYLPIHKCVLWGGGNNPSPFNNTNYDKFYKYDQNGVTTGPFTISTSPASYLGGSTVSKHVPDPVTGDLICFLPSSTSNWKKYVASTDTWSSLSGTYPSTLILSGPAFQGMMAPCSTYGVIIAVMETGSGTPNFHIYKHAASASVETPDARSWTVFSC